MTTRCRRLAGLCLTLLSLAQPLTPSCPAAEKVFRAGAYAIDITPTQFPVIVNGMFEERTAQRASDPLHARCLVLDDGTTRVALAVVDSLMLPRDFLDEVKKLTQESTGIPAANILISATHTHSAPSVMGCLGSRPDPAYRSFLLPQLVRGLQLAAKNLWPARVGWAVVADAEHTHNRRWIRRPDRLLPDPFGVANVRANMHPGYQSPDVIGPSGPVDTDLSLLAVQSPKGEPIAVLANYSMHYLGSTPVSADYYGRFCEELKKCIGAGPSCVVSMSQGTSGDLMWMDYGQPARKQDLATYAAAVAAKAQEAYQKVRYHDWVPLAMRETKLTLRRRVPDEKRLAWAREQVEKLGDRLPRTRPEIYAQEQIFLVKDPTAELKLQALRVGELGITAIPNEVFALTGLKLKAQSPLRPTFNIELANGAEGYIPPPEQHRLGGYTTWPARTAGLEVEAEPKIVDALLGLLEGVSGQPRRATTEPQGPYTKAILASKPAAYWRLGEMAGTRAHDASGHGCDGAYEDGVAFFLDGPPSSRFRGDGEPARAAHFAGGLLAAQVPDLGHRYSLELWFWNGLPNDARPVTGYLFGRGTAQAGDHLGVGGSKLAPGRLLYFNGNRQNQAVAGQTDIPPKTWNHVVLVRDGRSVKVYLNGHPEPEVSTEAVADYPADVTAVFVGGREDRFAGWEGKLAEVAVYARALAGPEVVAHYRASGVPARAAAQQGPLTPEQSLPLFRLPPGLKVERVAAEPDVQSPVAMAFDEDGRLWVVEMLDYPNGPPPGQPPEGRIKVLEDRDGSGRYRVQSVFADQLLFANGVLPWKGGVVVTAAPYITHLQDADGDGRADRRTPLYEGFTAGNPQLRVSHPNLGIDNWVYVANGMRGGRVRRSDRPDAPVLDINGRDFRFDLVRDRAEAVTGMGQFGNTFDDWGRRFVCSNRNHWVHLVLPERYVRRNPYLAVPPPHRDNQGPGGSSRVYPISRQAASIPEHVGSFTAACGVFVYRGSLLPAEYRGAIFTCEPTGNLVHQEHLLPAGASFTGRPARPGVEFLATTDGWCRPVFLTHGPDGALYVVDMYRKVVEHPEWLPPSLKTSPDVVQGKDRGRIWRIVPDGQPRPADRPRLSQATTRQLVELLAHPDAWWRTTAQRLLLERQDPQAVAPLRELVTSAPQPLARVHAAWLLEQAGRLDGGPVLALLRHEHPRVREHGVRLAERWLPQSEAVQKEVVQLAGDDDPRVRFQVALSLGEWDDDRVLEPLARIALANVADRWSRLAVQSSVPIRAGALLAVLFRPALGLTRAATPDRLQLVEELAALVGGRRDPGEVGHLLETLVAVTGPEATSWRLAGRKGLAQGLLRRGTPLAAFVKSLPASRRPLLDRLDAQMGETVALARDGRGGSPQRVEAAQTLAHLDWKTAGPVLTQLVSGEPAEEVRLAAVNALAAFGSNPEVTTVLLKSWPTFPPAVRRAAAEVLLSQPDRAVALLQEMETGRIHPDDLDALRRLQLVNHRRSDVRERSRKLFKAVATPERRKVLEEFQSALKLPGDPRRGREVFQKAACVSCHRVGGLGVAVGPDIADTPTKTPAALLADILDPNAAIDANFVGYLVSLKNGQVVTGLLAAESASSLTLRRADNQTDVVLRQDVEPDGIVSTGKSLMPEGLEKELTPQQVADLLAFLKRWRELDQK